MSDIDYTSYTLEELLDCQQQLDANAHPERAAQIALLIKDRAKSQKVQRVTMAEDYGNIASVKTGRAPSLGRGLSELFGGGLFGLLLLTTTSDDNIGVTLVAHFVIASAVVAGCYHIYNALSENRFSAQDIVAPHKETDPFDRFVMGKQRQKSSTKLFCTHCGASIAAQYTFCPKCGKEQRKE